MPPVAAETLGFSDDDHDDDSLLMFLGEFEEGEKDLVNSTINSPSLMTSNAKQTSVNSQAHEIDAYCGEIAMLKHMLDVKQSELDKIKTKTSNSEEEIQCQLQAAERNFASQVKNLQTQLLFKQQEINETRKANMMFQAELQKTKSELDELGSHKAGNDQTAIENVIEISGTNQEKRNQPETIAPTNLRSIDHKQLDSVYDKILLVSNTSSLGRYLSKEFFNINSTSEQLMLLILLICQILEHGPSSNVSISLFETLYLILCINEFCDIFVQPKLLMRESKLPNGETYTNYDFHQSKQKILMILKSELNNRTQNELNYRIIHRISAFNSEISNYLIQDICLDTVFDYCIENQTFLIPSLLADCENLELPDYPCSQSYMCKLNKIICKMKGEGIPYIKSVLSYLINILTCCNFLPTYIITADCLCNINLYESLFSALDRNLKEIDCELAAMVCAILSLCHDEATFQQRIDNVSSNYCYVYFKLLEFEDCSSIKKTLDELWIFDIKRNQQLIDSPADEM